MGNDWPNPLSAGNGKNEYRITVGKPAHVDPMTYGRFVPERKDDFTWENNRSAFRVYGPALEATGEISNGMDLSKTHNHMLQQKALYP